MNTFDRFIAGDDALSRLIRQQDAFTPTAEQEARLLAAIAQLVPAKDHAQWDFEPPAQMQSVFLQEASRIAQAQAPRSAAALEKLRQGASPKQVFGARISEKTVQWLTQFISSTSAATAAPKQKSAAWWSWGGMALASVFAGAIGFQLLAPARQAPSFEMATAPAAESVASTLALQMAEDMQTVQKPRDTKPPVKSVEKTTPQQAALTELAANTPRTRAAQANENAALSTSKISDQSIAAQLDATTNNAAEIATPPSQPMMAAAPLHAARLAAPATLAQTEIALSESPKLERAKQAPATMNAKSAKKQGIAIMLRPINSDPQQIARELPSAWLEHGLLLRTADADSQVLQNWVENLRAALPTTTHITVETSAVIEAGWIEIASAH